jgi:ferredoxin
MSLYKGEIKMPWIDKDKCVGCEICVKECPVNAISMKEGKAEIDMEKCIRCGKCHEVCPQEAIRHDSEKIPLDVEENIKKTKELIKNFNSKKEKQAFLERMIKHFNKEIKVAEKTINKIKKWEVKNG